MHKVGIPASGVQRVKAHGICGNIATWIANWLSDRKHRVCLNVFFSSWKLVLSGVPQGSVLGPVLFIIYINDIDDNLTSPVLKFADDTKLYRAIASNHDILNLSNYINQLCFWSKEWKMLLNVEKCKVMHIEFNNLMHYIKWEISLCQKLMRRRTWGHFDERP